MTGTTNFDLPPGITRSRDAGMPDRLVCSCGASCREVGHGERNRFLKRHPKACNERRELTKQLAQGTRSVDYDEAQLRTPGRVGYVSAESAD